MTIKLLKYNIIQEVTQFKSEWTLLKLKQILKELAQEEAQKALLLKPTRQKSSIADLKKEQNYKGEIKRQSITQSLKWIFKQQFPLWKFLN